MNQIKLQIQKWALYFYMPIVAGAMLIFGGAMTLESLQAQEGGFEAPTTGETTDLQSDSGQVPTNINLPQQTSLVDAIINVVNVILGILGILLVVWLLYGGILYAFSGGDDSKTAQATSILTNAIIGLVIIGLVWALSNFLVQFITTEGNPIGGQNVN